MKGFITAVLGIALSLIIAIPAFADGAFFGLDPSRDIYQPAQKAIILYENNRENLILQVKYKGDADKFAWVVPVPNVPDVDVSEPELFEELAYFTMVILPRRHGLFGTGAPPPPVDVLEEKVVGIYRTATLSAEDPQALINWLNSNGYLFPEDGKEILDYYIHRKWYFIALKINTGEEAKGLAEGTVQPLRLSFDSDEIVYPLKLTSLSSNSCEVLLYVFADQKVVPKDYRHLSLNTPEQVAYLERKGDVFYLEYGEEIRLDELRGHLHELSRSLLAGDQYYLTKMKANIPADKMVDIELTRYEKERYLDSDGDGWSDDEEAIAGTKPNKVDTDGDGMWDPEDPYPLKRRGLPGYALVITIMASVAIGVLIWLVFRKKVAARD